MYSFFCFFWDFGLGWSFWLVLLGAKVITTFLTLPHEMFIICTFADSTWCMLTGDPELLTHGVDQYGFVCGSKNTYNGTVVDLTEQKYLYYLDPFALLNTSNLPWAASICVSECPSVIDLCEVTSLPCRNSSQYR